MLQSPPGATPAAPAMDKSSPCGSGAPGSSAGSKGQQPRSASAGPAAGESKPKGGKSWEGGERGAAGTGGFVPPWVCGEAELRLVGLFVSQLGLIGGVSGHCLFWVSFSILFRLCSLFGGLRFLLSPFFKD